MESHVNENSEVKGKLLSEEKLSKPMRDSGKLRQRTRRDSHSGTTVSKFTARNRISEEDKDLLAKKKPSNRRHDREKKLIKPRLAEKKGHLLDEKINLKSADDGEVIPGASRDLLPISIRDEADLIGQEMAKDDELDWVHQEIQMLENAPDGPLLATAKNQYGWRLKDVLEWVFPITNFTLELPSAVFDQLSSKNHPHYAFIVMLFSFIALMSCIAELIYKGKMERVTLQWRGSVPWFYLPAGKPFGTLLDKIGFACAFLQCVVTTINYSFISRHLDGPINVCVLPILLAFGLLCSKYFKNPVGNRGGNPRFNRGALQV